MKNFEVRCPTDGTSALQPEFDRASASRGAIIEFPGRALARPGRVPTREAFARETPVTHDTGVSETARALRFGSMGGCAYGRVRPWQAAVAGCVFSALALASMFVGL